MMKLKQLQHGTTTVEFALIGFLFFLVLLAVLEMGRLMFTWNSLAESTRRTARLAVVCPLDHGDIPIVGNFNRPGGSGDNRFIIRMNEANLDVDYLDSQGDETSTFTDIDFVRVRVVNYEYGTIIPGLSISLSAPTFTTTLPVESLGYIPDTGTFECFGSAS
jgi:hypothetical protein